MHTNTELEFDPLNSCKKKKLAHDTGAGAVILVPGRQRQAAPLRSLPRKIDKV